jgi:hypothetical protein
VSQVLVQRVCNYRNGNVRHGPDRQCAYERVPIIAVLTWSDLTRKKETYEPYLEKVGDDKMYLIGFRTSIADEEQVYH